MYQDTLQSIVFGGSSIIVCTAFVAILEWIKKKLLGITKKHKDNLNTMEGRSG